MSVGTVHSLITPPTIVSLPVAGLRLRNPGAGKKYAMWNRLLAKAVDEFELKHHYSTVFEFLSHDIFTRILDDPVKFGFNKEDESVEGGGIWVDHLHPTSAVHSLIAKEIEEFLRDQPQNYSPGTPLVENGEPQSDS